MKRSVHLPGMLIQEIQFKHKKKDFYCRGGPRLEQVSREVVESLSL